MTDRAIQRDGNIRKKNYKKMKQLEKCGLKSLSWILHQNENVDPELFSIPKFIGFINDQNYFDFVLDKKKKTCIHFLFFKTEVFFKNPVSIVI